MSDEKPSVLDDGLGRFFHCDCGWAAHALHVKAWHGSVEVTVVNAPADLALRHRLHDAWRGLRGDLHVLSEIIIAREEWPAFVEYINAIDQQVARGKE